MPFVNYVKYHKNKTIFIVVLLIYYAFCLPKNLFTKPTSTVITSTNNELLGALITEDGQWRFPHNNIVSEKFKICLIQFEDEHFYKHPGFNPLSIFKALKQNLQAGRVVRGGSTITQQVIRLSRDNTSRTYFEKVKELILATRLELKFPKEKILAFWSSNAPFGGNVVGLDAASWRYFNRKPTDLSWAESATLAVLPNAPNLIYPGKNQQKLLAKRNRLLKKLLVKKVIDSLTYDSSKNIDKYLKYFNLYLVDHKKRKKDFKRIEMKLSLKRKKDLMMKMIFDKEYRNWFLQNLENKKLRN